MSKKLFRKLIILISIVLILPPLTFATTLTVTGTYNGTINGGNLSATCAGSLETTGADSNSVLINFSAIPPSFHPYAFGNSVITFYCPMGIQTTSSALNLFDLTGGNYTVTRTYIWAAYGCTTTAVCTVSTAGSNMLVHIHASGNYDGPTNLAGVAHHPVRWIPSGLNSLTEEGTATFLDSSKDAHQVTYTSVFNWSGGQPLPGTQEAQYAYNSVSYNGTQMYVNWFGRISIVQGPTLTGWGLVILVALLISSAVFVMLRRRKASVYG